MSFISSVSATKATQPTVGTALPPRGSSSSIELSTIPQFVKANSPDSIPPIRGGLLEQVRAKYPNFEPRNDWEILALSNGAARGDEAQIRAYLDMMLAHQEAMQPGGTVVMYARATAMLDMRLEATGSKPPPGSNTPNVFVHPIPDTDFSLRLFPGSAALSEYCLDFVRTETGAPVNSPFEFELLQEANALFPQDFPLRSLESCFGRTTINPGEEKFVLRDGMPHVLKRKGHKDIRFTVPIRVMNLP
ncbi:hypothetical protein C8Q80DRAFT_1211030 [Daedaleopsis nitida]|nr:hypothetical protein C8Q80DRAFT_1211030 [Daedaleopsis nitida]